MVESVSGANLSNQPGALQALADQVVVGAAGAASTWPTPTTAGQAIFAGTGNVTQAYDQNGNYVGGGSAPTRTVAPGVQVAVGVTGDQVFGIGDDGPPRQHRRPGPDRPGPADRDHGVAQQRARRPTSRPSTRPSTQVTSQAAAMGANYQRVQAFSQQATSTQQVAADADVGHRQHQRRPGDHPAHRSRSSRSSRRCGPRRSCHRNRSCSSWDDGRGRAAC